MDNFRWAPRLPLVVVGWLAAAGALYWCLFGAQQPMGRLLGGVAVLLLGTAAMFGSRARPRLAADGAGIGIRGFGRAERYPWSEVNRVQLVHTRRFGRDMATLEIDLRQPNADERLVVFGWLDLGADPREVSETLAALRPSRA